MNFQGYLENAYRIIKAEPLLLVLGGLLIQLLNSVTLSIFYGPLFGGYLLMVLLLLRDGKKPEFNDLFSGFKFLRLLFPYFFVLLVKIIGFMLLILPGLLFATWWIYVLPLMVDRKISFGEAMRLSSDKVTETGFFVHLVFLLLVYVIPVVILNMLISLMPFLMVLTILLMPFQVGCMVSLYIDRFGRAEPADIEKKREGPREATVEDSGPQGVDAADQAVMAEEATPGVNEKPGNPGDAEESLQDSDGVAPMEKPSPESGAGEKQN